MAKQTYLGLRDPRADLEALKPAHKLVVEMMTRCRPYGPDYRALLAIVEAMNRASDHFVPGPQNLFARLPHSS